MFRKSQAITQPNQQYGGLSFVVNNSGQECYTQSLLEQACLDENQQCFNQAGTTPCMVEPLFSLLSGLGDGPAVQSVLDGTLSIWTYPHNPILVCITTIWVCIG